jgi:UDP-glucuronate decarboxylase
MVLLSDASGEIYNVGTDENEINMMALANMVNDILPKKTEVKLIEYPDSYPAGEPRRRAPDLAKIRQKLGYVPRVGLKEGLSRTMAWYEDIIKDVEAHN